MNSYVGQRVVFIGRGEFPTFRMFGNSVPEHGEIYTVRAILGACCCHGLPGFYLCEIVNSPQRWSDGFIECGFCSTEFRPLSERKTDISVFQKMLTERETERLDPVMGNPAQRPRSCAANWAGE